MPETKIRSELYEQFKRWFEETYGKGVFGWAQKLAMPKNEYESLIKDRYFQSFLQQTGQIDRFPEIATMVAEQVAPKEPWKLSDVELGEKFRDVSKEPYPPPQGKRWEVVSFDAQGLPAEPHWELKGIDEPELEPFDPLAMTEYQREQAGLAERRFGQEREEFDWRKQQAESQAMFQQRGLEREERLRQMDLEAQALNVQWQNIWRMMSSGTGATAGDLARMERERTEFTWQQDMAERMSTAPTWVERENLELQRQQHEQRLGGSEKTLDEMRDEVEVEYLKAVKAERVINEQVKDPNNPLYGSDQAVRTIREWKAAAGRQLNEVDIQQAQRYAYNYPSGVAREEAPVVRKQTGVEYPGFMTKFVPGLGGKFIPGTGTTPGTAPEGTIPSPQSWRGIAPSQQQKLAEYWEYAGQEPQDIFTSMQQMLPQRLTLGQDWRAVRQV